MQTPKFVMLSAGFEHGGNVTHRHLDGHPNLAVYPFESQLGTRDFHDFLASIERVQYRYPEFHQGLSGKEIYDAVIDEELKTYLRKREYSKFRHVDLQMSEDDRINRFVARIGNNPAPSRAAIVMAYFEATFGAWKNYYGLERDRMAYVGYSPGIGIDANRIVSDFPEGKVIHVIRNPFSAYRDTKRRPFPQSLSKYLTLWNLYHSTVVMHQARFPNNVRIVRYEDLVGSKRQFMENLAQFIGIPFDEALMTPSWNNEVIEGTIAPWGTVLADTVGYNQEIISELSLEEIRFIAGATRPLAAHFDYLDDAFVGNLYRDH